MANHTEGGGMKVVVEGSDFIRRIEEVMPDSKVPAFFKKATGRKYTSGETCVNDIRRLLMTFWNDKIAQKEG
jgi:hypothetical protein